jgi:bacteriocin-like protein
MTTITNLTEVKEPAVRELSDTEMDQVSGGFLNNIIAIASIHHSVVNQLSHAGQNNVVNIAL